MKGKCGKNQFKMKNHFFRQMVEILLVYIEWRLSGFSLTFILLFVWTDSIPFENSYLLCWGPKLYLVMWSVCDTSPSSRMHCHCHYQHFVLLKCNWKGGLIFALSVTSSLALQSVSCEKTVSLPRFTDPSKFLNKLLDVARKLKFLSTVIQIE